MHELKQTKTSKRMFYCQDDGGQWNVPVTILWECQFLTETLAIVIGDYTELSGLQIGREMLLLVNMQDLHESPVS